MRSTSMAFFIGIFVGLAGCGGGVGEGTTATGGGTSSTGGGISATGGGTSATGGGAYGTTLEALRARIDADFVRTIEVGETTAGQPRFEHTFTRVDGQPVTVTVLQPLAPPKQSADVLPCPTQPWDSTAELNAKLTSGTLEQAHLVQLVSGCDYFFEEPVGAPAFLQFSHLHDLILDGQGATLHLRHRVKAAEAPLLGVELSTNPTFTSMTYEYGLQLKSTQRVLLTNLRLDYQSLVDQNSTPVSAVSYGVVAENGAAPARQVRLDAKYSHVLPVIKTVLEVDPVTHHYVTTPAHLESSGQSGHYTMNSNAGSLVITGSMFDGLKVGSTLKVHHIATSGDLFDASGSRDLSLVNVTILEGPGRIGSFNLERGLLVDHLVVHDDSLEQATLNSGFMIQAQSDVAIINSTIDQTADDPVNVKATALTVANTIDASTVKVTTLVASYFSVGDSACLFTHAFAFVACLEVAAFNATDDTVTFAGSHAAELSTTTYVVAEPAMTRRIYVAGNSITNSDGNLRLRGSNMFISANRIVQSSSAGLQVNNAIAKSGGVEGQYLRHIIIENNTFDEVGAALVNGVIGLGTVLDDGSVAVAATFEQIAIRNNTLSNTWSPAIFVASANSVVIADNHLDHDLPTDDYVTRYAEYRKGHFAKAGLADLQVTRPIVAYNSTAIAVPCVSGVPVLGFQQAANWPSTFVCLP